MATIVAVCPCWDMSQCVYWRVGQGLKWASLHCGEVTAKPDKTGPRNSPLVDGKLKSRPRVSPRARARGNTSLRRVASGDDFLREGQQTIPVVLVLGAAGRNLGGQARRDVVNEGVEAVQ